MLTPSRRHLPLDTLSSFLPSHSLADSITIISRRLQILSYVLAEISSAAMLLDDYVRAVLNISHRLFTAWQSIAVAAMLRQEITHMEGIGIRRSGGPATLLRRWHRVGHTNVNMEKRSSPHIHSAQTRRGIRHGREMRKKLRLCYQKENIAARHVENARRVVVMALFQQFLQVVVDDSVDDLVLRDWIGPRHPPHQHKNKKKKRGGKRRERGDHTNAASFSSSTSTSLLSRESSENRFTDLTDAEESTTTSLSERTKRVSHSHKRARSVFTPQRHQQDYHHNHNHNREEQQLIRSLSFLGKTNDGSGGNTDNNGNDNTSNSNTSEFAFFPVNLQVFMRAAIAFNPTVCALQLMSRCVLHARHVRNVDDEVVVSTPDNAEGEEGLFYVVVAIRAVGVCEHNEPCFGNRKFFFVRYQGPEMQNEYEDPVTTTNSNSNSTSDNNNNTSNNNNNTTSDTTGPLGVMLSTKSTSSSMGREAENETGITETTKQNTSGETTDRYEHVPESTRAWSRAIDTLTQMIPELHRTHTSVHIRDSTYSSPRPTPITTNINSNITSNNTTTTTTTSSGVYSTIQHERQQGSDNIEEVRHGLSNHPLIRRGTQPREAKDTMTDVNNKDQEKEKEEKEKENEEEEEEEEEIRPLWLLMHSNRCSATGLFFTNTVAGNARLLTDTPTGPICRQPWSVDDYCVPFDQALFVPPNAGHDTMHRNSNSQLPPLLPPPSTSTAETTTETTRRRRVEMTSESIPTVAETLMSSGQGAFAEELIARLNFWCARGQPRRRRWSIDATSEGEPTVTGTTTTSNTNNNTNNSNTTANTDNSSTSRRSSRGSIGAGVVMPLKLLFTQVGNIRFRPQEAAVYCSKKGQELLFLALAESTELVICATREGRPHRKRKRSSRVRNHNPHDGSDSNSDEEDEDDSYSDSDSDDDDYSDNSKKNRNGGILSDDNTDPAVWGRYDHIATEAVVQWSQGDPPQDENDIKIECLDKEKEKTSTSGGHDSKNSSPHRNQNTIKQYSLTTREKHQCRNERLKIEFRLARSSRLDAILIDSRSAKPIAALTLCQAPRRRHRHGEVVDNKIVQNTTFIVDSFTQYVARLLRHLREEKLLMVDMDRTLVDNAILAGEPADMDVNTAAAAATTTWHQERGGGIRGDIQLYCEERKDVHYLVTDGHKQAMRRETIYVRRGVREMLRHFHLEWGIPLVLVTKSSLRRTEAILSQVLDPNGELFPKGVGRIFTAESIIRPISSFTANENNFMDTNKSDSDSNNHNHNSNNNNNNNNITDWQLYQQNLARAPKSIISVLCNLDNTSKRQTSPPRPRSVAVLDDAPHVWVKADWPCTVSLAPYTLDRVDPPEYFSPNGLIVSMLISVLYNSKCVVYPVLPLTTDTKDGPQSVSAQYERRNKKEKTKKHGNHDVNTSTLLLSSPSSSSSSSNSSINSLDTEYEVRAAKLRVNNSMESTDLLNPHAGVSDAVVEEKEEDIAPAEEAVVEEVGGWNDGSHWASADVEDVTPI